ncbi:MAG: hypothetical protein JNL63_10925 [Bacteroidia bacterium]|nr:hypothetical protein [Bacteroidia bacterium]
MELRFRPKFKRDLLKLKGKPKLNEKIYTIIKQIRSARTISDIPGHKALDEYKIRFRIKIKISEKENYRLGFILNNNTIWAERILSRADFYKFYRR